MELNAEQIKKALECCITPRDCDCDDCPLDKYGSLNCKWLLMSHSLSLIKELTEENERLRGFNLAKCEDCAGCTSWKCDCANIEAQAKADTVRKMQERLKEHLEKPEFPWDSFTVAEEVIDQIAKEMLTEIDK